MSATSPQATRRQPSRLIGTGDSQKIRPAHEQTTAKTPLLEPQSPMRQYHEKPWIKRYTSGGSNATRILLGFVVVTIVLRLSTFLSAQPRPKFNLMNNARCVPLHRGHLENFYVRSGTCFSRRQVQQIITDMVIDSSVVFDAYNLTYFLDSGTLLGSYRTGSVIPHDQDADFGFDAKSLDYIRNNPIAFPAKYELHVFNSTIHQQGTRFEGLPAKVAHKESGIYIDIFEYIDSTKDGEKMTGPIPSNCYGSCVSCPYVWFGKHQFQVPYDWIYPLQSCPFGGRMINCPAQPEKYLRYMFGDDFRTPDTDYVSYHLRVAMGFVVAVLALHMASADTKNVRKGCRLCSLLSERPKFNLMNSERCVKLATGHLDAVYEKSDACFSRRQVQQIITDLVLDSSLVFNAYSITYFLDSGTLLGSYRNRSLIPHDQDADEGIDEKSFENPIVFPAKYALHVFDSEIHANGNRDKRLPVRVVHKESALYMDVFVYIDSLDETTGDLVTGPLPSSCFKCKSCPEITPG